MFMLVLDFSIIDRSRVRVSSIGDLTAMNEGTMLE